MNIKPIKTEEDYQLALAKVNELMDAEMNTPEGDELDILATLIESYEAKHYAIAPPDPIEAIQFRKRTKRASLRSDQWQKLSL